MPDALLDTRAARISSSSRSPTDRYRCQFFYADADHYGTGRDEYDDLEDLRADAAASAVGPRARSAGASSGATAADLADDDYHGPAIL